jgi:DNA-binding winged helix-turn-helix (wHTH) protein/tetratricopeptide (TPR) repeat protein
VNDAVRVPTDGFLTTADLAARADFTLGLAIVSPSSRTIAGPGGTSVVEPRVMQVLVVLAEAAGQVVTRETLFQRCWGGVYVGDDSLNRTVGAIRKLAGDIAGGSFEIETIPRTGYRLTGEIREVVSPRPAVGDEPQPHRLSRRALIGSGAAAAALVGCGGWWWLEGRKTDTRFDALMARGDEAFRNGTALEGSELGGNNSPTMIDLYEQAVRLQPDSARAWGLLGYFKSSAAEDATSQAFEGSGKGKGLSKLVADAEAAIQQALRLDPNEPNARVGMFLLQGTMYDQATRDRILRTILKTDPNNIPAMMELMPLVQAAGLTRESWMWNERILHVAPFTRVCLTVKAFKLWILGRVHEADNVIDRVRALWPDYGFATYGRLILFALTGRPGAARALMKSMPFDPLAVSAWTAGLDALESRSPSKVETARATLVDAAARSPVMANDIVMLLCALGLTDTAFEVTDGFLLWRGKLVSEKQANGQEIDDYNRRMSQWLFTPPVTIMRADPRFLKLCDALGLTAYWRARHVRPDYQIYG